MRILTLSSLLLAGLSSAAFAQETPAAPETPPAAEAPAPEASPAPDAAAPADAAQPATEEKVDANRNGVPDSEELDAVKQPEPR
ncbi:MAG: hypothetical protein ABS87_11060 [Sphingomonas sp. SCN 67-18]|uniref:hypothetical protein n=1 Tax=uncultured Sphingomonas sp. TaxID=158754 RepID=UPI00086F845A|nr:hypothetical protein [Sphingomonas sp. SCN 67-18]ODU20321.1 MAG: hypothetical protein ABS87_11060 [Sphingomonas sp. SCN 67-18]